MADGDALTSERVTALTRFSSLPVAVRIAVVYVAARLVTTAFFVMAASFSTAASRHGAHPSLTDFAAGWDATWYWFVANQGYPTTLPLTDGGDVAENQWAFLPVYPYLAKLLAVPLGGQWPVAAVFVSLVAGYAASVVLFRLLRMRIDESAAMWAVVFFCCGPLAALFQVGYAETLALLLLFLALWVVQLRRFAWLYLLVPLLGFTRPGILAFALMLGAYGIWRWFRRREDPLPAMQIVHIVATGALAVVVGFSWQVLAGWVTGDAHAYLSTELAWRRIWMPGPTAFAPLDGFAAGVEFWFGRIWGWPVALGAVIVGLGVAAIAAALLFLPQVKALGVEVRLWAASYLIYLVLVFFPQSSIFRLLVPLSPLWGAMALPRSRAWRWSVLGACLLGQWWWILNMYGFGNTFWQVP